MTTFHPSLNQVFSPFQDSNSVILTVAAVHTFFLPPRRIHPNKHLQSGFPAAETLLLSCDF